MAATEVSSQEGKLPPLLERTGLRKRLKWHGSSTQLLWSKLESTTALCELCRRKAFLTEHDKCVLAQCDEKLELARRCIDKQSWRWSFAFWQLIHEVDGLLLLVLPEPMLLPSALEVMQRFQEKVKDPTRRGLWLGENGTSGPLSEAVRMIARTRDPAAASLPPQPLGEETLLHHRYVLRGALDLVNDQVDKSFWQLSINVTIQIFSTLLLLVFFASAFLFSRNLVEGWRGLLVPRGLLFFSLAGAAGATVSNMLSRERFVVSTGATNRYFVYYLLVKPAIGAFAALLLIFLEQSRMLLAVVVASRGVPSRAPGATEGPVPSLPEAPVPAIPSAAPAVTPDTGAPTSALVQIVVDSEPAAFFALAALAVAIGFSADRLLSSMMDRVLSRLWTQSEKTPPPPTPRPEGRDTVTP